jgi:hypothetical protein
VKEHSFGVAAFVTADWKEKGYPLDLWLEHHSSIADQVSLVTYGNFSIPFEAENVRLVRLEAGVPRDSADFWLKGKQLALDALTTEWKILLDIDEFLKDRPYLSTLEAEYVYPLVLHDLFGGLDRELLYAERFWYYRQNVIVYRVFKSAPYFRVIGDGNAVGPSRRWRIPLLPYAQSAASYVAHWLSTERRDLRLKNGLYYAAVATLQLGRPYAEFDVWHTTFLRPRSSQLLKLREQRKIHEAIGDRRTALLLSSLIEGWKSGEICSAPEKYLPGVRRVARVDRALLPEVLLANEDRFRVCRGQWSS